MDTTRISSKGSNATSADLIDRIGELENAIKQLQFEKRELHEFAAGLEQHNRDLQDFVYITAHDLQEPLGLIQAFGERLRSRYGDTLSEHGSLYLQRIESTAARMQSLIQGLLLYSRVTTESHSFVSTDLGEIVREVLTDLEARIEHSGARIEVGELPVIESDPVQMRQLFQNLIGNALKFSRKGRTSMVRLSSELLPPATDGRDYCRITVQDNGIGFDTKYQHRIFSIFQRLHKRTDYEGTGIGLTICKMIVERHAGKIEARGEPGTGATFIIKMPCRQTVETSQDGLRKEPDEEVPETEGSPNV
jgi:light-regulated signal transduction histidine kinase (bacteriophytochrome)